MASIPLPYIYDNPYKFIGKLFYVNNGIRYSGTACIVGRNTILTAAHNIFNKYSQTLSDNFMFEPAHHKNDENILVRPFGQWCGIQSIVDDNWLDLPYTETAEFDYGLIMLQTRNGEEIGDALGSNLDIVSTIVDSDTEWEDIGYPDNLLSSHSMCRATGRLLYIGYGVVARTGIVSNPGAGGGPWIIRQQDDF